MGLVPYDPTIVLNKLQDLTPELEPEPVITPPYIAILLQINILKIGVDLRIAGLDILLN